MRSSGALYCVALDQNLGRDVQAARQPANHVEGERLTGSGAHVAPYPFTTQHPEPGMMTHEDIHLQLVDLPAVSTEHPVPWLAAALQTADQTATSRMASSRTFLETPRFFSARARRSTASGA